MITLIKKYPYDNSYDYVKLFSTKSEQQKYFNSFNKIVISDEDEYDGYIKEGESFIVNYNYDYLVNENVNYLIFNNGYRNVYCFIISKQYVNDENTRLIYEVDVLNTYCFDFKLKTSFVERKKCAMNEVADFDEGMDIGEHVIVENNKCFDKNYTYFAMWKGFNSQIPTFKENGALDDILTVPYMSFKPFCYIDDIQYPVFFSPMYENSQYKDVINEGEIEGEIGTGESSEIVGHGVLPLITNSLGTYMLPTTGRCTAGYPYYNSGGKHTGVDIANVIGTPVYADKAGECYIANLGDTSFGKYVRITHDDGTISYFAHLSKQLVSTGQRVEQGDQIGEMGSTGNSTGPHLHWEIRNMNNSTIHPCPLLKTGKVITKEGIS